MAFLLFVDVFLVVVKGATDKLVPASMIQNKTIFELNVDALPPLTEWECVKICCKSSGENE